VEGFEAAVLASADLSFWRPRAIVVEAIVPLTSRPSHHPWEPAVLAAGYELAFFDGQPLLLPRRRAAPAGALVGASSQPTAEALHGVNTFEGKPT
jgi:hypothetical protein